MKKQLLVLFLCAMTTFANAQKPKEEEKEIDYSENVATIENIVASFYSSISGKVDEQRNWKLFKLLFRGDAKLIPAGKNNEGEYQVSYLKPADYIKNSGKWLVANGFIEKEVNREVDVFGKMAHVFSTYEGYTSDSDEEPSLRGINSFQLAHDGERWWIVNVFWTQETYIHPIPSRYLK
ncbi:hypothetical protein ACFFU1_09935 [Algibacter miyuki]|uniref:Nuclear transport factor 2 family protein n=1 Tax=Algibacter miyuki TaxID=1306933 RepID=A0ABV5H179_9FLAO|nr:hypothetical protein [Algibacter miyuki]MDN3667500.1 hypothetical protein [Algibacter miyuki]